MSTGAHPKELWPGVKVFFGHTYDEHPEEFFKIFKNETSDKAFEERVQYRGLGLAPVKSQGKSISFEDGGQGYTSRISNITYGIGGIVTREAIDDGQYESIAMRIARFIAFSIRQTQENVAANVINRATTAGYVGGDGVVLCSASHPEANGNQSNLLSVPADLSETAIEDLLIQIGQATDSKGLRISLVGKKLLVPVQLSFEATRILKSTLQSGTANNDPNAMKMLGMLPDGIVVNHYLTDADAWGIITNAPEGLIRQTRRAVEFGKDNDFDTENAKMKGTIREGYGWADWRGFFYSEGA
jgi:hypothetical protein